MNRSVFYCIAPILAFLVACQKDIDIDMPNPEEKIMVEGTIVSYRNPTVVITKSFAYTENSGTSLYEKSFIHNAGIVVTDETGNSETLLEQSVYDKELDYYAYYYTSDSFKGEPGKIYTLTIDIEGKIITSSTFIPDLVPVIDIWQEQHPNSDSTGLKIVKCKIEDPPGKNYYRYTYQINGKDGASPERSTLVDTYFDRKEYIKAVDSGLENEDMDIHGGVAGYFYVGDTITVNWMNVEQSYYNFWTTLDFRRTTQISPFMSPSRVFGNVEGALGYWSGLGVSQATIVLQ